MKNLQKLYLWLGIVLILASGVIHVIDAPDAFKEAAYKGWLFSANAMGALVAAIGIFHLKRWAWSLGLFISIGSILLYAFSRTIGLPLIPAEPDAWFEPLGVASLVSEGGFVVMWVLGRRPKRLGNRIYLQ
jgi:hypothetical protein